VNRLLVVCTLLGGLAATVCFWDKICSWFIPRKSGAIGPSEKLVDFRYPQDSGLSARLSAQGFEVCWCERGKISRRIDLEGWEYVAEEAPLGRKLTTGDLILLKKKLGGRDA